MSAAAEGLLLRLEQWLHDAGPVLLARLGLARQFIKLRRRELWFPRLWLHTALPVHWQHRPCWSCYWLHCAVLLAWLGGAGVVEGFRRIWRC